MSSKRHFWVCVSTVVYSVILICRVWGAHRFLHYEESVMVGSTRSESLISVWNDFSYGVFIQRFFVEFVSLWDLEWTPKLSVAFAVIIWLGCCLYLRFLLVRGGSGSFPAFLAPLALCLLPLPEIAYLGLLATIGLPLSALLVALVATPFASRSRPLRVLELGTILIIAMSTPPALVAVPILLVWLALNDDQRRLNFQRLLAIIIGALISFLLYQVQDPTMSYLKDWKPTETYEREVLSRLSESGSLEVRARASVGLGELVTNLPGSIRFVITQMYPEPWASRAILETKGSAKLLQVVVPIFLVILCVLFIRRIRKPPVSRTIIELAFGLFLGSAFAVLVQHVLVGQLTLRQYLFLPVTLFWMAILLLFGGAVVARSGRAICLLLPLVVVFVFAASQNFRDPFQENPRQGGMGRYASHEVWRPALEVARKKCSKLTDETIVVVTQVDANDPKIKNLISTSGLKLAWFDHPFVAKCGVIKKG
ncbi:MAG: hypothetical protein ACKOI3_01310 [Actinomycetota bacterium]